MVNERFDENISAQTAADMLSMSVSAFGHFFKKKTGMTFSRYLTEKRIAHACKKLTETENTVAEICFESGFENLSWFNRSFLKIKAMTPREYRKRYGHDYLKSYDHHQYLHREDKTRTIN